MGEKATKYAKPVTIADIDKMMSEGIEKGKEEMKNLPRKFKQGEGVRDIDPEDADKHLE